MKYYTGIFLVLKLQKSPFRLWTTSKRNILTIKTMREIKFRGRLSHSKQWVFGNLIIAQNKYPYIIPFDVFEPDGHHLIIDSDSPYWVDDETIGQFTGLFDKNGVEIYEGDILGGCNGSINGYEWKQAPIEIQFENGRFNIPLWAAKQEWDRTHYLVIIGNIHDNPELLTKN